MFGTERRRAARRPLTPGRSPNLTSRGLALAVPTVLGFAIALVGCKGATGPAAPTTRADRGAVNRGPGSPSSAQDETGRGGPGAQGGGRVLAFADGKETLIGTEEAETGGYTIIDLGDNWTPFIFAEHFGDGGQPLQNRYRRVFVGLANDKLDGDGVPLPPGEKNYLELYGVFPSLSVLRERFLHDENQSCVDPEALPALEAVETVAYIAPESMRREEAKLQRIRKELHDAQQKARVKTIEELIEKQPQLEPKAKLLEKRAAEKVAMAEVEKRLICEGMLGRKGQPSHKTGVYDEAMRLAVRRFQQKNMLYEANYLRRKTMDALARPTIQSDHDALLRMLRERVIAATGVIEDGSVEGKNGGPAYTTQSGSRERVRNLADELTGIVAKQLGVDSVEGALAFFKRHSPADFADLQIAVKLPTLPEYYASNMDLSIVIDRGDVWYDPPWDDNDRWRVQPRKKFPSLTLVVRYRDQNIALARWRTTIGGWRAEQAPNGYEYYRYKGSDVGPRVIRQVVSGPVWIAPASTPIRALVKSKTIAGHWQPVVNYDELGPGYLSAYGLVAGYFVIPGKDGRPDFDNGVRAHGSAEYLSMYSANGYSHGCHRLPNHLAIRMYDFLLRHRTIRVSGDAPISFWRQFLWKDHVYEMRIPSRGYVYQLDPPVPVNVLEGDIKGEAKKPIGGYVPKPGVRYPPGPPPPAPDSPEARAGGAGKAAPATADEESP